MTTPVEHKEDALGLNPQEFIELWKITLQSGAVMRMHSGREYNWDPIDVSEPKKFESAFVKISAVERNSGEQRVRPTLTLGNPLAIFHVPVAEGHLDNAKVERYKVKPAHLAADPPVFDKNNWYIAQVTGLGEVITLQLRSESDRQESLSPPRMYLKPEFSSVSI